MNSVKDLKDTIQIIEGLALCWDNTAHTIKTADELISDIYMVAHLHSKCKCQPLAWQKRRNLLKKELTEMGVI